MVSTNFLGLAGDEKIQVGTIARHAALLKTQLYLVKVPFFTFPDALNCSQKDRHCSYSNAQQAQHAFSPCSNHPHVLMSHQLVLCCTHLWHSVVCFHPGSHTFSACICFIRHTHTGNGPLKVSSPMLAGVTILSKHHATNCTPSCVAPLQSLGSGYRKPVQQPLTNMELALVGQGASMVPLMCI